MHKDGAEIHTWGAETHRSDSNLGQTPHGWTDRGSYRGGATRVFSHFIECQESPEKISTL